ncbi:hypothetical protein GGR01_001086 [Acetobacter oeni]|nr:hypothetical protein [Acetobacter oeni]
MSAVCAPAFCLIALSVSVLFVVLMLRMKNR